MTDAASKVAASPWTDDSGPNIIEIIHNPNAKQKLTPANLGLLLTVRFYEATLFFLI